MCCMMWIRSALALLLLAGGVQQAFAQTVRREYWLGIPGSVVSDLLSNPAYPNNPAVVDFLSSFEAPVDWADEYGTRIRGYVTAPANGSYFFWISSDDQSQLFLSTDD